MILGEKTFRVFGARVEAARKKKGLTQEELAERIGVSQSMINHIEKARSSRIRSGRRWRISRLSGRSMTTDAIILLNPMKEAESSRLLISAIKKPVLKECGILR